jgi:hypothetical protein
LSQPGLVKPQKEVYAVPPIKAGGDLSDIHPMRRGGVKSFVDDLVLGRGVVISRAATSLRTVETQPWTRRFVRKIDEQFISVGVRRGGESERLNVCDQPSATEQVRILPRAILSDKLHFFGMGTSSPVTHSCRPVPEEMFDSSP